MLIHLATHAPRRLYSVSVQNSDWKKWNDVRYRNELVQVAKETEEKRNNASIKLIKNETIVSYKILH